MAANLYLSVTLPLIVIPTYFYAKFMQYISILFMSLKWITENVFSVMLEKLYNVIRKLIFVLCPQRLEMYSTFKEKYIPSIRL